MKKMVVSFLCFVVGSGLVMSANAFSDDWIEADGLVECIARGDGSRAYVFTNGTVTATAKTQLLATQYLVVGGGGGGGNTMGGGGGGGGVASSDTSAFSLAAGDSFSATVGAGGTYGSTGDWKVDGTNGGDSLLTIGGETITATGGGGGGSWDTGVLVRGGAGGGTSSTSGTSEQGYPGGVGVRDNSRGGGGGGGGASEPGEDTSIADTRAGKGGEGRSISITGTPVVYGSGGGGGGSGNGFGNYFPNVGGENAGDGTRNGNGGKGVDGTGGGGGGGGWNSAYLGGIGGCGTVIVVLEPPSEELAIETPTVASLAPDRATVHVKICGLGAGASSVTVTYRYGTDPDNLDRSTNVVENQQTPGIVGLTLSGLEPFATWHLKAVAVNNLGGEVVSDAISFKADPVYDDEMVCADDDTFYRISLENGAFAYVFTNTAVTAVLRVKGNYTMRESLVVGGGGGGGNTMGGGGGGGGVVYDDERPKNLADGSAIRVSVGKGGKYGSTSGWAVSGTNGGDSTLTVNGEDVVAYGGGGGGSFDQADPSDAGRSGNGFGRDGASGGGSTRDVEGGAAIEGQGNPGGRGMVARSGYAGGGGGAGEPGGTADTTAKVSGRGGEGRSIAITGTPVVYGSGGGGGGDNAGNFGGCDAGAGGTNAGDGMKGSAGQNGTDGTGGGGGGGGWTGGGQLGGLGGSGTVIFVLEPTDETLRVRTPKVKQTAADGVTVGVTVDGLGAGAQGAKVTYRYGIDPEKLDRTLVAAESLDAPGLATAKITDINSIFVWYLVAEVENDRHEKVTSSPLQFTDGGLLTRITFTAGSGNLQLSEVAVYDRNTNRLNQGLKMVAANTPAADLLPGEFTLNQTPVFSSSGAQNAENLFDANSGTKQCVNSALSFPISYTMRFDGLATLPQFYDLMTANDNVGRSPTAWNVELSDDFGETWHQVDMRSSFAYPSTTYTWFAGRNNQGSCKDPVSAAPFALNVDPFAPFAVEGTIPDQTYVEGRSATPLPKVIDVATGEEITDVAGCFDVAYANNDKVGRATVTLTGREGSAYAGFSKTMLFNVLPEGGSEYYVRVTFKAGRGSEFQLSELAVYDAETNRLNAGLEQAADGLEASELKPGQYSLSRSIAAADPWVQLFDGSRNTKACATVGYAATSPNTWLTFTMRFADVVMKPRYYDLCTANDRPDRLPKTWTVEASDDGGKTWFVVAEQTNNTGPDAYFTWYGGRNADDTSAAPFELDLSPLVPFVIAPIPPQTLVVGAACEPEPVVTLRKTGAALTPYDESTGTGDYTVEYANNTRPGVATLTVSGCGKYAGQTLSQSFIINGSYVVAPDAEEGGTGGSWASPLTLAEAIAAAANGYAELWLKEGVYSLPAGVSVTNGVCIYGGFAGDETTRAARHGTGLSVIDGGSSASVRGSDYLLTLVPTNATSFVFDRMEFRGAYIRALNLSTAAAAELTLEDCTVRSNGFYVAKGYSGRGLSVSGGAKAKLAIRSSRFSENRFWTRSSSNGLTDVCGLAIYLTGVAETTIEDTLFFHNGDEYASGRGGIAGRDKCTGWCISANSSPLTVKNTDFIANNGCLHTSGAIVQLAGAIGATSFTSCRFVGNSLESYEGYSGSTLGGALTLGSSSGTLAVDFCTFAYNTCVMENGSGFTQNSGTSTIRNSIFYANAYNGGCADIYVRGGSCTVENCRLSAEGPTSYRSVGGATLSVSGTILDDPRFLVSEEDFERDYLIGSGDVGTRPLSSIHIYTAWKDPAMLLTGALDVHPKSEKGRWTAAGWVEDETTSPLLDRATADASYDNEPDPKGYAANLGGYGNTTEASKTPNGVPAIANFTEDLDRDPGSATYAFTLTSDKPFVAPLWFCWGYGPSDEPGTNGWECVMCVSNEVGRGAEVFLPLAERGVSFEKGDVFHWRFYAPAAYGAMTTNGITMISRAADEIAPETTEPTADYETDVGSAILSFQLGGTGVYSADVYLCSGGTGGEGTNGWKEVVLAGQNVKKSASFTVPLGTYFDRNETASWRIVVMIGGEPVYERDGTVTGLYDLPAYKGKKGPKYVIHVRAGAEGDASGRDWYNACTTLSRAFEVFLGDETKREIWVSGDLTCPVKTTFQLTRPLAVRGGFTTLDEQSPEDRAPGARSKLSSVKTGSSYPQILGGDTLDDFTFDRFDCQNSGSVAGITMGTATEGVKTLAVTDCRFTSCPGALRLTGNSHARAVIANCVFTNCTYSGPGAFQLTSCTEALVSNVSVRFCAMSYDIYGRSGWSRDDATGGWAVGANDTPTRFVDCEFVGNAYVVHKKGVIHAPVYVGGAVDGTEFVNCLFTANDGRAWQNETQDPYGNSTGALAFNPGSSTARLGIRNCTFAYNGYNASEGAAGIYAVQGEVAIRNSIFFGNFHLDASAGNIRLGKNATADIAWTMFDETNTLGVAAVTPGSVTYGPGIRLGDPLFVTPYAAAQAQVVGLTNDTNLVTKDLSSRLTDAAVCGAFDLHLKGTYRGADGVTHRSGGVQSPAVNAGDRTSAYDREPQPNGNRVNLGNYGNTPEATMSRTGTAIVVR